MSTKHQIIIVSYDKKWPIIFEQEQKLILKALNYPDIIIEHIGSTAIVGLSAKPIIDILLGIDSLAEVNAQFIEKLASIGYEYVPEYEKEIPERCYFRKKSSDGTRIANLHVAVKNSSFWCRHINFRDYLKTHPQTALEYEHLKRELSHKHSNTQEYAHAKTDFIESIEKRIRGNDTKK